MDDDREKRLTLTIAFNKKSRRYEVDELLWFYPGKWLQRRSAASVRRAIEKVLPVISRGGIYGF